MRRPALIMLLAAVVHGAAAAQETTGTISLTTCNPTNDTFGQIPNSRAPREIQLGLKLYW